MDTLKLRAITMAIALAGAHTAADAWFFFWIPTGQIQGAVEGNHCVSASAQVGDKINAQGRDWILKSTSGPSSRCSHHPNWPIVAKMEPVLSPAELATEHFICVGEGVSVGARTTIPNLGEVEVRSISNSGCSDTRAPKAATVVRLQSDYVKAALARLDPPRPKDIFSQPAAAPAPAPTQASSPTQKTVVERLRELKQLREENLITQEVYEAKQRDILSSQ